MAASLPECTLRRCVDEIVSETGRTLICWQCTPMPIRLLQPDASVYLTRLLNHYTAWIAFALDVGMTTFTEGFQGALV